MEASKHSPTEPDRPRGLQLRLPARAENVGVVRHALAGLAEEIGMDEAGVADLKTVVTEACTNVVVHAYDGEPGPMDVEATPDTDGLTVVVADDGSGMRPRAEAGESLRLGLSLIAALSSSFSISGGLDRGTEISMRIPLRGGGANGHGDRAQVVPADSDRTELVVDRPAMLAPVLGRLVGALAARRELSVDRVSDAVLVTDAISHNASDSFADGRVRMGLEEGAAGIGLRLGPMDPGAAPRIREELRVPGVGGSLEVLADELAVEEAEDGEYLLIRFAAP